MNKGKNVERSDTLSKVEMRCIELRRNVETVRRA
jgi:hypothetical protein